MVRPYGQDLRERAVKLVLAGATVRAVAERMQISVATVVRWGQIARATGRVVAKPMGGTRGYRLDGQQGFLLARLAEKPDLTLRALLAELRDRGIVVSSDTLWRFLRKEKLSFKKRCSPASKIAATPCVIETAGVEFSPSLILNAWSSSTKPGPRPT